MKDVITDNSRMHRRTGFKLGGRVVHVTRHVRQLFKVKKSNVKVTRSRNVSSDKTLTRQWMIISTSNLVRIIDVGSMQLYFLGQYVKQTGSVNTADKISL